MTQNVHKPIPSDMSHAIRQAVETMESYLSNSEIMDMIECDRCTLTAEYRPQMTADLERIYGSLDDYDKGILQDHLDDMWIMYCIVRNQNVRNQNARNQNARNQNARYSVNKGKRENAKI